MNVVGIIVEYNPFHNGHVLHVNESKQATNADLVVAVMSGNFLQRGEPALASKWARTKMALRGGVDIVLELPYVYATQQAETFANGAVSILNAIGVDSVCFGSENGNIGDFKTLFTYMKDHHSEYNQLIQNNVKEGLSYPKALATAFQQLSKDSSLLDLSLPNNILGYHYVKAISNQNTIIKPYTIKRKAAQYHDKEISSPTIASATSIREVLLKEDNDLNMIKGVVPRPSYEELQNYIEIYHHFQNWERLFPYLKYRVMSSTPEQLNSIYEAEEGLENRIWHMIHEADSFLEFITKVKTKRYTWTRLQRFCLHILTNTTKTEMELAQTVDPYVRILGMNKVGMSYLNKRKKTMNLPLISTISKHRHPFIDIEKRATTCYSFGYNPELQRKLIKEEYATPPIILTESSLK